MKRPIQPTLPLLLAAALLAPVLDARPRTSLIRTTPPAGWEGFLMRTTVEAGYIPAGESITDPATVRVSTTNTNTAWVNPAATYPPTADIGVPTVTSTHNPDSGAAKDTATASVDFDYILTLDNPDEWGFDISSTTSASNAMVDFGGGPEPADAFVEVQLEMDSTGPYLVENAWMALPPLPALNDPVNEFMIVLVSSLGHAWEPCPNPPFSTVLFTTAGYQVAPDPGLLFPFKLCPGFTSPSLGPVGPESFAYDLHYHIVTPFGTDPTYNYSGSASAAVVSPIVVTNANDSGSGSLRQAIADAVDGDFITFAPSLSGGTVALTTGELSVFGKRVTIDASELEQAVRIDAGGLSRVLNVNSLGGATLQNLELRNGATSGPGLNSVGGAVLNQGTLALTDCRVIDSGGGAILGGGVANDGGTLSLTRCEVTGNSSAGVGGGILNNNGGTLAIQGCEIHGNTAADGGGGVHLQNGSAVPGGSSAQLLDSSIHNNSAQSGAGILTTSASSQIFLINCTVAENGGEVASALYLGGGTAELRHCTVTRNSTENGAAIWTPTTTTLTVFSSILSDNLPEDVDMNIGTLVSEGYNLVGTGDSVGDFNGPDDQVGISDPELSPLGKYFSFTSVALPLSGSPAVDAGNTDAQTPPTDQRGLPRLADGDRNGITTIDIGAAETTTPTLIVTNTNDSGPGSLRQVVADVPDLGLVLFANHLSGQVTNLTSGEILIDNKAITINADSVKTAGGLGYQVSGNNASRIFHIGFNGEAILVALALSEGSAGPSNSGGAINANGDLTAFDCRFADNQSGSLGGALYTGIGTRVVLRECRFLGNAAASSGGAIAGFGATLTVDTCRFAYNRAESGSGGALYNDELTVITNSSFSANRASGFGGAIHNRLFGSLELEQCTLFGNCSGLGGGGLKEGGLGTILRHCTITGNRVDSPTVPERGSGIRVWFGSTVRCYSSIIAGNHGDDDVDILDSATFTSDGHNLVGGGNAAGAFTAPGDQTGITDPFLGPLGDNGGTTLSLAPLPGSPAIDAGGSDASSPATDQRHEPRIVDGDGDATTTPDVGAVETAQPSSLVVTNTSDSGPGSLRQAIADAPAPGAHITFDPALDGQTIALTSGELLVSDRILFIDADTLAGGIVLDAGGAGAVLDIRRDSTATLRKLTVTGGGGFNGGGVGANGGLKMLDCTVSNNSGDAQAGVGSDGPSLLVHNCRFTGNQNFSFHGGGILTHGTILQVSDSTFHDNSAGAGGGGLHFNPGLGATGMIERCSFTQNGGFQGGGIQAFGPLLVSRSTFSGNLVSDAGGAFYGESAHDFRFELDHCTFTSNGAGTFGGAIRHRRGILEVRFCTITDNSAPLASGGGISLAEYPAAPVAPVSLLSTIVSGNPGDDLHEGGTSEFTSDGHNLVGFGSGAARFTEPGDQANISNPRLAPLGAYGGPLLTMHPLPGSPVIDAGNFGTLASPPTTDQRGFARFYDGDGDGVAAVDIGAVELAPLALQTITVTNLDDFGPGSLRQALDDSTPGTLIDFDTGLGGSVIPLSGPLSLQVPFVKIDASALPEGIILNGQNSTHLLELATTAVVDLCAVTLEDGFSFECGGGIINEGVLTLNECTVRNCVAQLNGGGICNQNGRLVVRNSSLLGNEAADPDHGRGGALYNEGELTFNTVTLDHCTIADNTAGQFGGGIFNFLGGMDLRHATIAYNTAPAGGAGIATFGDLSAETFVFSSIIGGNFGSDIDFVLDPSNQFFSSGHNLIGLGNAASAFVKPGDWNNIANPSLAPVADYGGRSLTILPRSNSLALEGGTLTGLTAEADQRGLPRLIDLGHDGIVLPDIGAVEVGPFPFPNNVVTVTTATDFAPGSLRSILAPDIIPGTLVTFAPGLDGDTIGFTGGELVVSGLFIKIDALALPNGLELNGGGVSRIFNVQSQSDLELCGLTLRKGASIGGPGGAIFNEGFLTVRQCSFENNEAGTGGAIANQFGRLTLVDSTFSLNLANDGGAVHHDGDLFDRLATVDQCTFAENFANNQGGALFNLMGIMKIRHCTISENEAVDTGAGIATNGDSSVETRLFSSIVAGNSPEDLAIVLDPLDRYVTDGGNVIGFTVGTTVFPGIEDQVGISNPGLSGLGSHGGRTQTMVVEFGSPAREAGGTDPDSRPTDQRGFTRQFGNGPDSGAYEASGNGGYFVWTAEFIPPGDDASFTGHADEDRQGNGTEYGIDTNPDVSDPTHPNNVTLTEQADQVVFSFGIRPEAFDVIWVVQRSTDLQTWTELYRYDRNSETIATDVIAVLDLTGRRISVTDEAPPLPRAFYRLGVIYSP